MSLLETFVNLKTFFADAKFQIDNFVFKLHYRWTTAILLSCCALVTLKQYFGEPINCIGDDELKPYSIKFLNHYCWIQSTFSVRSSWKKRIGVDVPYPGVDLSIHSPYSPEGAKEYVFHSYYQWVSLVLFLQALWFYIPNFLWKTYENGLIEKLCKGLYRTTVLYSQLDKDEQKKRKEQIYSLAKYIASPVKITSSRFWFFFNYSATELANLLNVVLQIYLLDRFLGGGFMDYGLMSFISLWKASESEWFYREDHMIRLFPRMTKCNFHMFGQSGTLEKHDTICILPINILNEKIFLFIWFWFFLLAMITSITIIYRTSIYSFKMIRTMRLQRYAVEDCSIYGQIKYMLFQHDNLITRKERQYAQVEFITKRLPVGKWFLLNLIMKNIDSVNRRDLIEEIANQINEQQQNDEAMMGIELQQFGFGNGESITLERYSE